MPYLVNGQVVSEHAVRSEMSRIGRDPQWRTILDPEERSQRLRLAAEQCIQDIVLIEQAAESDPRPVDAIELDRELQRQTSQWGCPTAFDRNDLRRLVARNLRIQRTRAEMVAGAVKPTAEEIAAFFNANREQFRRPEMLHASHIVKYVSHEQTEEQAEAAIETALAELDRGVPFVQVANQHSD